MTNFSTLRAIRFRAVLVVSAAMAVSISVSVVVHADDSAASADDEMIRRVESLYQKAADARAKKDHAAARGHLHEALKQGPFTGKFRDLPSFLHLELAQVEASVGDDEAAMKELEAAAAKGLAEAGDIENNTTFTTLKSHPRMKKIIALVNQNAVTARVYDVTVRQNAELGHAPLHVFEASDSEMLRELAHNKDLQRAITSANKTGADEWQRQLALMAWVHNRWAHAGMNEPSRADAATILREVEAGKRFRCVEYSVVLAGVMQHAGHPARVVSLRRDGSSYGIGKGHVVAEVWSNQRQKWVVMDGQNNGTWQAAGVPLSAAEVRRVRKDDVASLRFVRGPSSWQEKMSDDQMFKEWVVYFDHLTYTLDNTQPAGRDRARVWLLHRGERPELLFQGVPTTGQQWTRDFDRVYPHMNGVHVDVWPSDVDDLGTLQLQLTHAMPWFDEIVVMHNGKRVVASSLLKNEPTGRGSKSGISPKSEAPAPRGGSGVTSDLFARVVLAPGANTIEVHAVNKRGVRGPSSWFEIAFSPPVAAKPAP